MKQTGAILLLVIILPSLLHNLPDEPGGIPPALMLWAWERPEDLSFVDSRDVGVAFWAGTVRVRRGRIDRVLRLQSLKLPEGIYAMPVIRIDTRPEAGLKAGDTRVAEIRTLILEAAGPLAARALQLDFDARESELPFFGELLGELRERLPASYLTVTGLAGRCLHSRWHDSLPVDDAIPMLFRMGADALTIRQRLSGGDPFRGRCGARSLGLSTDEPLVPIRDKQVYLFSPRPWSHEEFLRMTEKLQ